MGADARAAPAGPAGGAADPEQSRRLLARAADRLLELEYTTWGFGDSVAFEAMVVASRVLGEDRWLRFAQGWFRAWATRAQPYRRLDCTAPGLAMVQVHEATGDSRVLEAAVGLAGYLRSRPRLDGVFETWESSPLMHPYGPRPLDAAGVRLLADPPPGVFVDCLHFDPPFLTALGQVVGDAALVDEGVAQALGYVRLLQSPDGLFDHFVLFGTPGTHGPGWGRGQGWALLGLLDVADRLPPADPRRGELLQAVGRLVAAMVSLQRPDGSWPVVVTDAGSGDEGSTAAFMAHGLARAVRCGAVGETEVSGAAARALRATLAGMTAESTLAGVSAAVMACTEPAHYAHVPRGFDVPWGQGPLVLALSEQVDGG
jgi:unsaturated rhamnogalacturonyl hydrolase